MTPQDELVLLRAIKSGNISQEQQIQALRAIKSGEGSAEDILGPPKSSLGMERAKSFDSLLAEREQQDENFDYETGASGKLRALVSFGETPGDKEAILKKLVGEEGYTKDSQGRLALTPEGQRIRGMEPSDKNIVLEEKGFSFRDVADLAGLAPETIGSVVGGILGAPGFFTGAAGAAAGAVAGQAVEEAIESFLGVQTQTAPEVTKDLAKEALLAGSLDAAGTAMYVLGKKVIGAGGKVLQKGAGAFGEAPIDDATRAKRGLNIMRRGRTVTDPATGEQITVKGFVSPKAGGLGAGIQRPFEITSSIAGFDAVRASKNVQYALAGKEELLQKYGAATLDDLAESIKDFAPAKKRLLEDELIKQENLHLKAIDDTITVLSKSTNENVPLDDEIINSLIKNYNEFMKQSNRKFTDLDRYLTEKVGSAKLFKFDEIRTKFQDITGGRPAEMISDDFAKIGSFIDGIAEKGKSGTGTTNDPFKYFASFEDLRSLRKNIADKERVLGTRATTPRRGFEKLIQEIDDMVMRGVDSSGFELARATTNPVVKESLKGIGSAKLKKLVPAAKQLKAAREHYAKEIGLFTTLERLRLVQNFQAPGADVTLVVGDIVGQNFNAIVKDIRNIKAVFAVGEKYGTKDQIQKSLQRKFLNQAMDSGQDALNPSAFNGQLFNNEIIKLGKNPAKAKLLFGDDWNKVKALGKSLALGSKTLDDRTLQEVIKNADQITPDQNIVTTLESVKDAKINLDKATNIKALKEATSGGDPAEAAKLLTNKNITPSQANQILDFFSGNPTAIETIKKTIINDILSSVDEGIFVNASSSASLKKALDSYDQKVLEKLIGKEELASIRELSEELLLLSDTSKKGAGSLAADAIRTGVFTNPWKNIPKVARFKGLSRIINDPKAMIYALEVKAGEKTTKEAAENVVRTLNNSLSESAGRQVDVAEELTGGARRAGRTLDAINRGRIAGRQAGARTIITPQEARGVPPEQPKRTTLDLPIVPRTMDFNNLNIRRQADIKPKLNQESIRQRAAKNPYLAAALLGGLGSASLLKN